MFTVDLCVDGLGIIQADNISHIGETYNTDAVDACVKEEKILKLLHVLDLVPHADHILLLAGLVTIPTDQYESADLDGASGLQKFFYITTPQMWYSVFFALIFSVINAFKCFREIFLIGGEHPSSELYMLQHFINNSFNNLNYPKLSVASVLLLVIIVAFFGVFYVFIRRKEAFRE